MRVTEVLRGPFSPGNLEFNWRELTGERYFDGTERDVLLLLGRTRVAPGYWHLTHLEIPGTDYTQVLQFCRELEAIRDIKAESARWRALKDLVMAKLDSPSAFVAREALEGIRGGVLQDMQPQEIQRLLSVLAKGNPMREFDTVLALGSLGKLDLSQRLAEYADEADAVASRKPIRFDRDLDTSSHDRLVIAGYRRAAFVRTLWEQGREFRGRVNTEPLYQAALSDPDKRGNAILLLARLKDPRAEALLVERLKNGHTEYREGQQLGLYQTKSAFKALVELYSNPPKTKIPGGFRNEIVAGLLRVRSTEAQTFLAKTGVLKGKAAEKLMAAYGDVEAELESERRADERARGGR